VRHGDEQVQVLEWVYARLSTDEVLADLAGVPVEGLPDRVHPDVAPSGTPAPWLVYSAAEGVDAAYLGAHPRAMTTVPLNVRWITEGSDPGAGAAAARRIYALLQGNHNTPVSDGGLILTVRRSTVLNYPEDAGGIQYRHTGAVFVAEVN
jgi:hypothetical protein